MCEEWTHFEYAEGNPYIAKTEKEVQRILKKYGSKVKKIKDGYYFIDNSTMRNESARKRKPMRENHRNPLDEIPSGKMRVIELDNGDYYYLNYENGKLQAGHTTNNGFYPEYEIEYDWDFSLDHNIESLYDLIEDNFRFESVSKVRKKARRLESMRIGTRTRVHKPIKEGTELPRELLRRWAKEFLEKELRIKPVDGLYTIDMSDSWYQDEDEDRLTLVYDCKDWIERTKGYKFDECEADEELDEAFYMICEFTYNESYRKVRKPIRKESMGSHLAEYQKWVDYDMERYGRISDRTMDTIRKAGLSVVKDQYGEYEVIAYDRKESLNRKRIRESAKHRYGDTTLEDYIDLNFYGDREDKHLLLMDVLRNQPRQSTYFGINMSVNDWKDLGRKYGLTMKSYPVNEKVFKRRVR